MAITWDDILNDKDFKAYPTAKKVAVAIDFFKNYIAPYYKPEELPTVKTNFFKTLQEKPDKPSLMEGFVKPTVDATSQFITSTGRAFVVTAPAMAKFVADVPINTIEGMSKGQSFKESLKHGWYKASDEATELMDSSKYLVSPEAQQAAERINKLIGKAGAGYAGIAELIKTGDLQKAVNVIKDESGQEGSTAFVPAARVAGDVATFISIFGAPRTARQFKTMTKAREMPQVKLERALSAKNLSERRAVLQEKPYGVEPISSEAPVGKTIPVPEIAGAAGGAQLTAKLSASDKVNLIRQSDTGRLLNVLEEARNQDIINKTDTTNAQKLVVRELVKRPDIADAIAKKLESGEKLDKLRTTLPDIISEPLLNKLKEMALPKEKVIQEPTSETSRLFGKSVEERGQQILKKMKKDNVKLEPIVGVGVDRTISKANKSSKPVEPPAISFLGTQGFYEKVGKVVADIRKKITIPENLRGSMKTSLDSMIEHHRSIRHSEFLSKELTKAVNDVVKDPERQFLMAQAYEHQMKGKYWEQLNPTEKELVNYLSKEKAKLDQFIKDNDILEMKEMPQGVNHIFHHWIDPKTGKPFKATYGKFTKGLPQARQRTHMTFEEGMKNGLKPATVNLGELIGLEWEAAVRANSARELFKTLHGVKGDPDMTIVLRTGKPAKPIRMIERWDMLQKQGLSEDYVRYSSPFLDKALSFKNADGEIIVMKGAVGIQKELYPFVKAYIETPDYGNLSQLNFVSKSMKLGISMFHVVSLGMQELANFRIPFKNIPKGLRLKKDLTPELKILHQEGLELFKGYEDLGYRNQFFEGKTVVGKTGNIITYPVQKMRDFIFDVVQPGMKVSFADMQFRKLLPRYLKDAKETMTAEEVMRRVKNNEPIPEAAKQCAREVVQKADGHFSGEDYKRSLLETNKWMVNAYFTPKARKFWQALLLSPTWQREHLLVAKNVAKSFMPNSMIKKLGMSEMGAIKSQYRKYALGGIMIVGAVDLWNQMSTFAMDGERKHIWENPEGKGFAVRAWWDEPDYVIENEDGSERVVKGGAAYFRPLKSLFEVAEMAHDPITKFSYKISPVVSAIGEQFWHAPWKYKEGWGDIPERLKDFALTTTAPIIATQAVPVFKGQKHPMGAIMPSFGFPTSKVKADYKDEATVETKSIKNEFNKLRSAYFKTKDVKDYNAMVEFANTQEPKVRKQLEEKYKQEVILKDSPDRAFWKSAISARPKIVGKMMFDKMKKLPPEKQQEFNAMAHRLGLDTPKAIEEYNRLATEYMAKMQ